MKDDLELLNEISNLKNSIVNISPECLYEEEEIADIFRKAAALSRNIECFANQISRGADYSEQTYDKLTLKDCRNILKKVFLIMAENDFADNKLIKIKKVLAEKFINPMMLMFY